MTKLEVSTPICLIVIAILAWFVYGTLNGVLAMLLLEIVISISLLIALIPFVGILFMYLLSEMYIIPNILSFTHIEYTWLVDAIKIFAYVIGFFITAITTFMVLGLKR